MNASRYVDMMGDSANFMVFTAPAADSSARGMLETASMSDGMVNVSWNVAFSAGSSQHGKERRADDGSNCVVAMVWDLPAESVYWLR